MKPSSPPPFVHPDFKCRGCNTQLLDCPMIKDDLWHQATEFWSRGDTKRDLLCLQCVEKAIGRQIEVTDLRNCLGNAFAFVLNERMAANVEKVASEWLMKDAGDDSVLTRLARVAHRSPSEAAAISNIRTALMGILEE